MKILYGVQATGNGHITRARALCKHFKTTHIDIDYLFSGRAREDFFDMEDFGDFQCKSGLTFVHKSGQIDPLATVKKNRIRQLFSDIKNLDLSDYDLVLTDFEPITAWAARRQNKPVVGIGHQYAFGQTVPRRGDNWFSNAIMRNFAPAATNLGLHWHHFGQSILPPIAEVHESNEISDPNKIVVYLGFEDPAKVMQLLEPFEDFLFVYYGEFNQHENRGHIQLKPLSREGFKKDLATCGGVISNAGFELSSEAIQMGKKILVKPLVGQMEQLSNACALEKLGLGMSMDTLDANTIETWLKTPYNKRVQYPDVALAIVNWLANGDWQKPNSRDALVKSLWQATKAEGVEAFSDSALDANDLLAT